MGALFAGQINSGIHASWLHVYLALHPEWKARVRAEVDGVIARKRRSSSSSPSPSPSPRQSAADVLAGLAIEDWETAFPLADLCLRETIRLGMPGTGFRKNTTGRDLPIGGTGEVIPAGAFAAYWMDDVHRDPAVYADPDAFDPGRYLDGRAEDKKAHHGFLGWGAGRHPCRTFYPLPPPPFFPPNSSLDNPLLPSPRERKIRKEIKKGRNDKKKTTYCPYLPTYLT